MAYATVEQLATYLGAAAPSDGGRLLDRASELIRFTLRSCVFTVGVTDDPLAPALLADLPQRQAVADATCAQVEMWLASDEEEDVLGPLQGVAVGGLQEQYGAGTNRTRPMYLSPRAARHLLNAGMLSSGVLS